jgi:hypothetical protein
MEQESLFARHLTQPPGRIEALQNSFSGSRPWSTQLLRSDR